MTCTETRPLISPFQDGELPPEIAESVEKHLASCEECSAKLARNVALSDAIRLHAPTFVPPAGLGAVPEMPRRRLSFWPFAVGMAAGFAAAVLVMMLLTARAASGFAGRLVALHVRSLGENALVEVRSSERHTVKPWFQGKLDFAPTVPDLSAKGFPLLGGRLDRIGEARVAALVYGKGKHYVNVIVEPERRGEATNAEMDGFRVEHWTIGDLGYWAVSDIERRDLREFRDAFVAAAQ